MSEEKGPKGKVEKDEVIKDEGESKGEEKEDTNDCEGIIQQTSPLDSQAGAEISSTNEEKKKEIKEEIIGTDDEKEVLDAILREAKKGSVKHQELYLKYIDIFGEREEGDIIYEAEFVNDKKDKD